MLRAFDAPTREECTVKRTISNTPSAALTLLNDPTFVEAARVLAVRVVEQDELDDKEKLKWLWNEVLSRDPQADELNALSDYLYVSLKEYSADPKAAEELLSVGLAPVPEKSPTSELAAWTTVCRALLNLSESITRNGNRRELLQISHTTFLLTVLPTEDLENSPTTGLTHARVQNRQRLSAGR
jgi:hypothetical protein